MKKKKKKKKTLRNMATDRGEAEFDNHIPKGDILYYPPSQEFDIYFIIPNV